MYRASAAALVLSMDLPSGTLCGRRQLPRPPMGAVPDESRSARAMDRLAEEAKKYQEQQGNRIEKPDSRIIAPGR